MAIGLTVTKLLEKSRSLCTLFDKSMHAKEMAVSFRHKNQLYALIQFTYVMQQMLELT